MTNLSLRLDNLSADKQGLLALKLEKQTRLDVPQEESDSGKHLVGYIIPKPSKAPTMNQLSHFLRAYIPSYMVPNVFVLIDVLPLLSNGKVDRNALSVPSEVESSSDGIPVEPRTDLEDKLAEIWREILKVEQTGTHDNFFDLGGHSLLATRLISRVNRVFDIELPLRSIFETPTIDGLAVTIVKFQAEQTDIGKIT